MVTFNAGITIYIREAKLQPGKANSSGVQLYRARQITRQFPTERGSLSQRHWLKTNFKNCYKLL